MAQANNVSTISPCRFHNLADPALADALGHADAVLKGAEAECKLIKDEFKRRGLFEVAGRQFTVTATEQIAGRLDAKAVKEYLGQILPPLRECGCLDRHPDQIHSAAY
jgi:hypothetical protein